MHDKNLDLVDAFDAGLENDILDRTVDLYQMCPAVGNIENKCTSVLRSLCYSYCPSNISTLCATEVEALQNVDDIEISDNVTDSLRTIFNIVTDTATTVSDFILHAFQGTGVFKNAVPTSPISSSLYPTIEKQARD